VRLATPQVDRRQLSVLFCDLVGSTALSTRIDPEDLREVLRLYQNTVAAAIQQCDGYVADYRGDGVLAYFGWPSADEVQACNAVRAASAAVVAVPKIVVPSGELLAAKASVATGYVVVGDLPNEGGLQAAAISGETPNRAARIESEAKPGQVLIDGATKRLLGAHLLQLKGAMD
jgi:class 3 adenylate cyclase